MKLNKRLVTLGLLILILSVAGKFLWMGLKQIKVDDFHPAAVIFVIDSSASNQKQLPEQKKTLRQICNLLDPEDQIKILRFQKTAYSHLRRHSDERKCYNKINGCVHSI